MQEARATTARAAHNGSTDDPADALAVARRYFDAWNAHDPAAIVAAFAEGGTYTDPLSGTLTGAAIGEYAAGLFAAFPDLAFEIVDVGLAGAGLVVARWLMHGTNTGPFNGLPPTGRTVALPGADFIAVAGDRVRSVDGYFDTAAVPRQLGLQVITQPTRIGPFTFGTSIRVHSGRTTRPGAFGLTVLEARSDEEVERVRRQSQVIATEMLGMDGFISVVLASQGRRMMTVSAWERPEDIDQLRTSSHREAAATLMGTEIADFATFGVWTAHRQHPQRLRCTACASMEIGDGEERRCRRCGAALPELRPYW